MAKEKRSSNKGKQQQRPGAAAGLAAAVSPSSVGGGGGSQFIGFSAFAEPSTAEAAVPATTSSPSKGINLQWAPVYTGSEGDLHMLFSRLGKRDATTRVKALNELSEYFAAKSSTGRSKKAMAEALAHYGYVDLHRLQYDESPATRAAALRVWTEAAPVLPRAFRNLLEHVEPELCGRLFAGLVDPAAEVRNRAEELRNRIGRSGDDNENGRDSLCRQVWWNGGVWSYARRILDYGRPSQFYREVFATSSKKQSGNDWGELTEAQRESFEECHERMVGAALEAMELWIRATTATATTTTAIPATASDVVTDDDEDGSGTPATRTSTTSTLLESTIPDTIDVSSHISSWLRTLKNSKAALRRKTYQLVATTAMKCPDWIFSTGRGDGDDDGVSLLNGLSQVLSSVEKEAANVPTLLETLVAVLVARGKAVESRTGSKADADEDVAALFSSLFQKPLAKLLKRGCYGARVSTWGPTLLPLLSVSGDGPLLPLMRAALDGRDSCFGQDRWLLMAAVAECAAFALLRRRRSGEEAAGDVGSPSSPGLANAQAVAQLWIDVWHEALNSSLPSSSASNRNPVVTEAGPVPLAMEELPPQEYLLRELARGLVQFQQATKAQRGNCAWHGDVETWFWGSGEGGLTIEPEAHPLAVSHVVRALREKQQQQQQASVSTAESKMLVLPILKAYFVQDSSRYAKSSGAVPSLESYQLYQEVFEYCGPASVVDDFDTFVMNDLLRWIIIHTSALSSQTQSTALVRHDFGLLSCVLLAPTVPGEKRQSLWQALLREVIQAQCRLTYLVEGLRVLLIQLQQGDGSDDSCWMRCSTMDSFALDVGMLRYPPHPAPASVERDAQSEHVEPDRERLKFLRQCLGIQARATPSPSPMLVSRDVLTEWIKYECPAISPNAVEPDHSPTTLLETLLSVVDSMRSVLEMEEVDRILLHCWYREGPLFDREALRLCRRDRPLCLRFVLRASDSLRQQLDALRSMTENDPSVAIPLSKVWSHRAWRLIQASKCIDESAGRVKPSFDLVSLANVDLWQKNPDLLYLCTMSFLDHERTISERVALVMNCGDDAIKLLGAILLNTSEASDDAARASRTKCHDDRCASFLSAMGGRGFQRWNEVLRCVVKIVSDATGQDEGTVRRGVAVISQLVANAFRPIAPPDAGQMVASTIAEGSELWYITDSANPTIRERVDVVKVHYDAQAGYYFSIRLKRSGEIQERQTVVERLRKNFQDSDAGIASDALTTSERLERAEIRDLIYTQILERHFAATSSWQTTAADLAAVLCCSLGLGLERGAGSVHYGLFQRIKSTQDAIIVTFKSGDATAAVTPLWNLSLSLGYGFNVPSSDMVFKYLPIDPFLTYSAILEYFEKEGSAVDEKLSSAILAWLSTSIMHAASSNSSGERDQTLGRILAFLFELGRNVFEEGKERGFCGEHCIACRAIFEGFRVMSIFPSFIEQSKSAAERAAAGLVKTFACCWENEVSVNCFGVPGADWESYSSFAEIMSLSRSSQTITELFIAANESDCVEALCDCLFVESKRYDALGLLYCFATTGTPIFDEFPLEKETTRRLKDWIEGLEDEEAEEIEDDVEIASRWLSRRMMNGIEDWGEKVFEETGEATAIGRLLTWLCVLQTVDVVAPNDFRYRPAFLSYLIQCGAANAALNVALLNDECINVAKGKTAPSFLHVDEVLSDKRLLDLPKLSSLVLFQTFEVLPSLSRRWWEESCPKVYINDVQAFVEKHVAPEIFKREVDSIRSDTCTFGDMSVRASPVSREVTAGYVQDEFTLSVRITVPPAFPLRSAEVDCSKTLGVPQQRWKRWSLQITQMLNAQGGSLQDALLLWKDNVDREFEGIEPCPVCYSVLHVKTHKLPVLQCTTCQWFRSSGKTQCVLCQQPWQGTRLQ